jgi:EmrB/QacA subfamily drug resistance transporter
MSKETLTAEKKPEADATRANDAPAAARVELPRAQRRLVTIGVMLGMSLGALEATAVSTAMPTVVAQLHGIDIYSWVFSIYLLTSTVTLPLWGKLSDLYGRRPFYLLGIGLFLIGSALSGQADSMPALIAYRAIQGFGAGALLPLGLTIIGDIYSLKERTRMQGLFSGVWGLASIIGPLLGGLLTDHISWRWVFYFNIPFGLAAGIVVGSRLKEPVLENRVRIDYRGAISFAAAITLFLLAFMQAGQQWAWASVPVFSLFAASALLLVIFAYFERGAAEPIIPVRLFRTNAIFRATVINGLFAGMAFYGSLTFLPLFAQGVMGTSATMAGTVLVPLTLSWVSFSVIGSRLILRLGYRPLVILGMVALGLGFLILTRLTPTASWTLIYTDMVLLGMSMGLSMTTLLIAVQNAVPRQQRGVATSATQFFRIIGGAIGVAVMGSVMAISLRAHLIPPDQLVSRDPSVVELNRLLQHPDALIDPLARRHLSSSVLGILQGTLAEALHRVFIVGLVAALLALATAFLVPKGKAADHAVPQDG